MICTRLPARSRTTLEAKRSHSAQYTKVAQTSVPLSPIPPQVFGPGTTSSVMIPVVGAHANHDFGAHIPTSRHRQRYISQDAIRHKPVNVEAVLAVLGLLAGYVVLVVLVIATSARPSPAHQSTATSFGRPLNEISREFRHPLGAEPVFPEPSSRVAAESVPASHPTEVMNSSTKATPVQPPAAGAIATAAPVPKPSEMAQRERALALLKKARESQSDIIVYQIMLAELVRSYGDTPAGAEALKLIGELEAANCVDPIPPDAGSKEPEQSEEPAPPKVHYGLLMLE